MSNLSYSLHTTASPRAEFVPRAEQCATTFAVIFFLNLKPKLNSARQGHQPPGFNSAVDGNLHHLPLQASRPSPVADHWLTDLTSSSHHQSFAVQLIYFQLIPIYTYLQNSIKSAEIS